MNSIFGRAPGLAPSMPRLAGFGGTGGIFTGPTALGTFLPGSFGSVADTAANATCKAECYYDWYGDEDGQKLCEMSCESQYGGGDSGSGMTNQISSSVPSGQPGACNSTAVIKQVQALIGAQVDGKWGPESQSKLAARGGGYKVFAPGCTGPEPSAGGVTPSYTTPQPSYTTPPVPGTPVPGTPGTPAEANMFGGAMDFLQSKFMGVPVAAWAAGIVVVSAVTIAVARQKGMIG